MLCNRVEEVSEDTVDVTEQLNEYIRKDELTRDDVVDVFAKIDNDNHVITLEFEDTPINGLIVFKTFTTTLDTQHLTSSPMCISTEEPLSTQNFFEKFDFLIKIVKKFSHISYQMSP